MGSRDKCRLLSVDIYLFNEYLRSSARYHHRDTQMNITQSLFTGGKVGTLIQVSVIGVEIGVRMMAWEHVGDTACAVSGAKGSFLVPGEGTAELKPTCPD